jgi:arylsulfatase A-like enzyme
VDDLVGELAAALEQAGELESTVFVFSSDNGYNRGSHRLDHKHVPYDESARIPLAVSGPGWESRTETRLVTHLDVVPTMFELAGVRIPGDVDGMSLLPLLDGVRVDEWRTDFLIEFDGTYGVFQTFDTMRDVQRALATGREIPLSPTYRALRSADWLYVEWYAGRDHDYELYDMRADPYQMENLLATSEGRSDRARVVDELHARLEELVVCRGVSCRT